MCKVGGWQPPELKGRPGTNSAREGKKSRVACGKDRSFGSLQKRWILIFFFRCLVLVFFPRSPDVSGKCLLEFRCVEKCQCPHTFLLNINSPRRHPHPPAPHPTHNTPRKRQTLCPRHLVHWATCPHAVGCTMEPFGEFLLTPWSGSYFVTMLITRLSKDSVREVFIAMVAEANTIILFY